MAGGSVGYQQRLRLCQKRFAAAGFILTLSMRMIGVAGLSGSGKTTLLCQLLPYLIEQGLCVSTIKHAHHAFDIDQPGKDSFRHRQAGATQVMIAGDRRWALMHEHRTTVPATLYELVTKLDTVDLLIIEGFKKIAFPKVLIHRHSAHGALQSSDLLPFHHLVAVASDTPTEGSLILEKAGLEMADLNSLADIAHLLQRHAIPVATFLDHCDG